MKKTKVFISSIPFLGQKRLADGSMVDMLEPVVYKPVGNDKLTYPSETRFPIVPVIHAYTEAGDEMRVIAILTDGEKSNARNTKHNYTKFFEPEIMRICKDKKLVFTGIELIHTPDNEDMDTQLRLFSDIADMIHPGEELYACISYGTKPMPIILTLALNYACKLLHDVSVGCIVYGRFPHIDEVQGHALIYDTTSLFYMDSIISRLAAIKASDPAKAIKLMLGLASVEDE